MKFLSTLAAFCLHLSCQAIDHPFITTQQLFVFNEHRFDPSLLSEFPFSAYEVVNSTTQGRFYVDVPNHDYIKTVLSSKHVWEPEIVKFIQTYVKPGTIAIDVGAHIGVHTVMMSRVVQPHGLVLAFEPQAKIHRELVLNLELNDCKNVIPIHAALGAENGNAYLEPIRPKNEGYRCISSKNKNEKISVLKLDNLQLSPVSCIKIDAESYELELLRGAHQTIMSNKPVIIIEIGGGWSREQEENIDPKEHLAAVINMLENVFNYNVTTISAITGDYLAIPKN